MVMSGRQRNGGVIGPYAIAKEDKRGEVFGAQGSVCRSYESRVYVPNVSDGLADTNNRGFDQDSFSHFAPTNSLPRGRYGKVSRPKLHVAPCITHALIHCFSHITLTVSEVWKSRSCLSALGSPFKCPKKGRSVQMSFA